MAIPQTSIVGEINLTATTPNITWGGSPSNNTGTGWRGAIESMTASVAGVDRLALSTTGLTVTGTLTVSGAISFSGAQNVVGNFSVATNKFTVAAASGNTVIAGTLAVTGVSTLTGALVANGGASIGTSGTAITKVLKGTVSVTIPALLTATNADVTVTITGAAAGDLVQVTPLAAAMEANVAIVGAFVSAANTVKVRVANIGAGTLTGSTTNFTYMIVQS